MTGVNVCHIFACSSNHISLPGTPAGDIFDGRLLIKQYYINLLELAGVAGGSYKTTTTKTNLEVRFG